jgi:putative PEP-CTERM system TPR-repeat lipoprotein
MSSAAKGALVVLALVLVIMGCDTFTTPQQRVARVRAELASGQWGLAAIELRKLVQADEHNAAAWLLLARLALDMGDARAAQSSLDHALAAGAQGAELDTLRARTWLAAGHAQALIDALGHGELAGLSEPDRSVELARAYVALRQPERAQALLAPVLEAHPNLTDARLADADALIFEGKSEQALAQVDRALSADPHSSAANSQRGRLMAPRGHFSAAEASFALALHDMAATTPLTDRMMAMVGLTEARLAQSKIDLAAQSQAALAKLAPSAPSTQLLGARIKLARSDSLGGIADLQSLVARAPSFVQAQMLLGNAQLQQGNLGQAQEAFQRVVQQAPDNLQARELLAGVRLKLNQPEEALRTLTPALSEQVPDRQFLALLGAAESRVGNADAVLESLERALQAHPQDRTVRLNLAQADLSAGRASQALTLLEGTPDLASDLRRDGLLVAAIGAVQGPSAATAQVEKLLSTRPRDGHMLNFAASYFASQGQLARAQALLHQALELNAHDVPTLVALAQVDAATGDPATAESTLRTALAADSASLPVRITLADLLIQRKAFADAEGLLTPVSGAQAGPPVQFALARLALARGDLTHANALLDLTIAQQPKSAELINQAGTLLMQANQYDAALARYGKATQLAADNPLYWFDSGRAQLALNESSAARESFEKAAHLQPQWLAPVSALVLIDLRAKDYQSARARVRELLASRPGDADAPALQGDVEWAAGQRSQAQAAYLQAQKRRPTAALAAKLFRVRLADGTENPEQALLQWLTLQPNDHAIRTVLGDYYLTKHAVRQAAVEFQTILRQVPSDVIALNNLAWCYAELHDPRAESLAERAYQLAPMLPNVNDTLGWILIHDGKTERALTLLEQAAKLDPSDADVQYHYAYALVQQGKRAEAHQILSTLLATKRDFDSRPDAERLLADTQS